MADGEDQLETMKMKHRADKKQLQHEIQKLKQSVNKQDKQRRKEIVGTMAKMEMELEKRHEAELVQLDVDYKADLLANKLNDVLEVADDEVPATSNTKLSKTQKRRQKKELEKKERERRIAEAEIEAEHHERNVEQRAVTELLEKRNLRVVEIRSDGNCMYSAVAHQLGEDYTDAGVIGELRGKTAEEIRSKREEYLPFLTNADGDLIGLEMFDDYCTDVERDGIWAGEPEIQALSCALARKIIILQMAAPEVVVGERFENAPPIVIVFHKHVLGLGAHYNSTEKIGDGARGDDPDTWKTA